VGCAAAVAHAYDEYVCVLRPVVCCRLSADELNLRLNAISQRLTLSLQLIPIQKTKAMDKRLVSFWCGCTKLKPIDVAVQAQLPTYSLPETGRHHPQEHTHAHRVDLCPAVGGLDA
jgi:hypothetical protein